MLRDLYGGVFRFATRPSGRRGLVTDLPRPLCGADSSRRREGWPRGPPPLAAGASPPGFGLGVEITCRVYKPRDPRKTSLYGLLDSLYERVKGVWEERFERSYGFWRGLVDEVVASYLDRSDDAALVHQPEADGLRAEGEDAAKQQEIGRAEPEDEVHPPGWPPLPLSHAGRYRGRQRAPPRGW